MEGDELVLGPFQGDIACTRIARGRGVCGTSWQTGKTLVVPDVEAFPGHIACSSSSRSEIVVPLRDISGEIVGVLDIDSDRLADFSEEVDRPALERIAELLAPLSRNEAVKSSSSLTLSAREQTTPLHLSWSLPPSKSLWARVLLLDVLQDKLPYLEFAEGTHKIS